MQTRRERVRQAAIDEIKSIAWEAANSDGVENVTVNGIARRMGMTPPAFYSYFNNRDELIRALVVDAYRALYEALVAALDPVPESDSVTRLYSAIIAYRQWAIDNPSMFALFAGRPVAGFENQDTDVIAGADRVHDLFLNLCDAAWRKGIIKKPGTRTDLPESYVKGIRRYIDKHQLSIPKEVFNLFFKYLILVHGMISTELSSRFTDLQVDRDEFYRFQIIDIIKDLGIDDIPQSDSSGK